MPLTLHLQPHTVIVITTPQGDIRISRDEDQGWKLHIYAPREFEIRRESSVKPLDSRTHVR